jgi:hypothetical protein
MKITALTHRLIFSSLQSFIVINCRLAFHFHDLASNGTHIAVATMVTKLSWLPSSHDYFQSFQAGIPGMDSSK